RLENGDPQGSWPEGGPAPGRPSREGGAGAKARAGRAVPPESGSSAGAKARGGQGIPHGSAPAAAPGRGPVRVPVQIAADTLMYEGKTGTTRFEGHALYTEPGRTLSAQRITTFGAEGNEVQEVT